MFEIDYKNKTNKILNYIFLGILGLLIICLFLPVLKTGDIAYDDNDNAYMAYTYQTIFKIVKGKQELFFLYFKLLINGEGYFEDLLEPLIYVSLFYLIIVFMIVSFFQNIITIERQSGFANNKIHLLICLMFVLVFIIGQTKIGYSVLLDDGKRFGVEGTSYAVLPYFLFAIGIINLLVNIFINLELFEYKLLFDKSILIKTIIVGVCSIILFIITFILIIDGFTYEVKISEDSLFYETYKKIKYGLPVAAEMFESEGSLAIILAIPAIILGLLQKPAVATKPKFLKPVELQKNGFMFANKDHHFFSTFLLFFLSLIIMQSNKDTLEISSSFVPMFIIGLVILIIQNIFYHSLKKELSYEHSLKKEISYDDYLLGDIKNNNF